MNNARKDFSDPSSNREDTATQTVTEVAQAVAKSVKDQADKIAEGGQQVINSSLEHAAQADTAARQAIRENPGLAVGAALGVGILVGLALRSRSPY
jgi:ElaB/YqjD/DUF883 family membrane-anchored ribosome-binding protein